MSKNMLTVLGSSSGIPQADRGSSGYVLEAGNSLSVVDCGSGTTSKFLKYGFDPLKVQRVFVSHTHPDHVCDLPLFIQMIYLTRRENKLELYIPEEFVEPCKAMMAAMYLLPDRFSFPLEIHGYSDGFKYHGAFGLTAIGNTHLVKMQDVIEENGLTNKLQCHSFKITAGGKPLLYSADIGSFDDLKPHTEGCGTVLTELSHVDTDDFFPYAAKADVGRFVITHLGDEAEVRKIEKLAQDARVTNLEIAYDGMTLEL